MHIAHIKPAQQKKNNTQKIQKKCLNDTHTQHSPTHLLNANKIFEFFFAMYSLRWAEKEQNEKRSKSRRK